MSTTLPIGSATPEADTSRNLAVVERFVAAGVRLPADEFTLESPLVLTAGQTLDMSPGTVLRIGHTGTGITTSGQGVTIIGGEINGGEILSDWTDEGDGTWSHPYTLTNKLRDFWVGDERRVCARYPAGNTQIEPPNYTLGADEDPGAGWAIHEVQLDDAGLNALLPLTTPTDVELWNYKSYVHQGGTVTTITDDGGDLTTVRQQYKIFLFDHDTDDVHWYLQNAPEFLTPGTWCHDRANARLLYMPNPGETLANFDPEVPRAGTLLEVVGTAVNNASIKLTGTTFRNGSHTFADSSPILASTVASMADLVFEDYLSDIEIDRCLFLNLAYVARIGHKGGEITGHIRNSRFQGIAATGLVLGQYQDPWGVASDAGCFSSMDVEGCIFDDIGAVYRSAVSGLRLVKWRDGTISRCIFRNSGGGVVTGGAFGQTYTQNGKIEGCRFHDLLRWNDDGGAVYLFSAAPEGFTVEDCYFHDIDKNGYFGPLPALKAPAYLESLAANVLLKDNLFASADTWHMYESPLTRGNILEGNSLGNPPDTTVYTRTIDRPWNPSGDKAWYLANHQTTWNIELTGVPTDETTAWRITFSSRTFYFEDYVVGKYVYFVDGNSAGNWYRITAYTDTTLDLVDAATESAVAIDATTGNFCVVCPSWTKADNAFKTTVEMDALVASWLATHPEPATP